MIDELGDNVKSNEEIRAGTRNLAETVHQKLQAYNKSQYDKRHKKCTVYREGDLVLVRILQRKPGENPKLLPKYKGPYRIGAVLKKNRYVVTDIPGYNVTAKPYNTILSPDKLKPWIRVGETNPLKETSGPEVNAETFSE